MEGALVAVVPNTQNNVSEPKPCIMLFSLLTAQRSVCQSVQQYSPGPSAVLSWCRDVLVPGERRLLPSFSRQRLWGQFPRTERAHGVSHRGLWGMDSNHHCYAKVSCIQVKLPFLCAIVAMSWEAFIYLNTSILRISAAFKYYSSNESLGNQPWDKAPKIGRMHTVCEWGSFISHHSTNTGSCY